MRNIILVLFGILGFALTTQAKRSFLWEDFSRLSRADQKRYLGVMEKLYVELEEAQKMPLKGGKSSKKKYNGYWNTSPVYKESFLQTFLFSLAIAAEGGKVWCFNNGVIAEVPECKRETNWGFVMTDHIKPLLDAGISHACGEPALDKPQPCGILGLQSDYTLACSQNKTKSCIESGDKTALVNLIQACAEKKPNGDVVVKEQTTVEFQKDGKTEKKELKCKIISDYMKAQFENMTKHCNPTEGSPSAVPQVVNICKTAQSEITAIVDKAKVEGPQTAGESRKLLVLGDQHMLNDNFGGELHACLSKAKLDVKAVARENATPAWAADNPGKASVLKTGNANESCIENVQDQGRLLTCKRRNALNEPEKTLQGLLGDAEFQADTVVVALGDGLIDKIGTASEAEVKTQFETMIKSLKEKNKGCILVTPTSPAGENAKKTPEKAKKIIEAIKAANLAASGGDAGKLYCSVIDSHDLMASQKVQGKEHFKPREGGDGIQLHDDDYKEWAKRSCEEIQKNLKPLTPAPPAPPRGTTEAT